MKKAIFALLAPTLLALAWWALTPGLSGGFLFDDLVNLPVLGEYGGVRDAYTLALYLTSGLGDPLGRPAALASFLIDARTWPAAPQPFLRTNLLLHLVNGALLALVLYRLGGERQMPARQAYLSGLLGAGIWLLHPLMLSTTLYIVQREAMLPATFTLFGMLLWLQGRARLLRSRSAGAYALLVTASVGCTAAASLCKANGVLLPLLLLVTEATVLAQSPTNPQFIRARRLLLGMPVGILALLLLWSLPGWVQDAPVIRPWTLAQRILTEPRMLFDYLGLLALPRPITSGVFHDSIAVSTGWLQPVSTLPAFAALVALIAGACRWRRRYPLGAFAVLFYFSGHVLESSVVPLELYFEHRNYLPATMLFWPLAVWLMEPGAKLRLLRVGAALLVLAGLAVDTRIGATMWGQPVRLALAWAEHNPDSPRAQAYAAQALMSLDQYEQAAQLLSTALAAHPEQTQLAFNLADAQCAQGALPSTTIFSIRRAIGSDATAARLDFSWLRAAIDFAGKRTCKGLELATVESFVQAARDNPHFANAPGRAQDFDHLQGLIALARNDADAALTAFNQAADVLPQPQIALTQAALLGGAGRPDLGLRHLDCYLADHPPQPAPFGIGPKRLHAWLLDRHGYWQEELARVHGLLAGGGNAPDNRCIKSPIQKPNE